MTSSDGNLGCYNFVPVIALLQMLEKNDSVIEVGIQFQKVISYLGFLFEAPWFG